MGEIGMGAIPRNTPPQARLGGMTSYNRPRASR
jgi:hypothetical protein